MISRLLVNIRNLEKHVTICFKKGKFLLEFVNL